MEKTFFSATWGLGVWKISARLGVWGLEMDDPREGVLEFKHQLGYLGSGDLEFKSQVGYLGFGGLEFKPQVGSLGV